MSASVHAVILNYKRPQNIERIVRACLNSAVIAAVHVVDQADAGEELRQLPTSPRIRYKRLPNIGAGRRLSYAATLDCDLVVGIDDDIFPTAEQLAALIERARRFPNRAHGIWGQVLAWRGHKVGLAQGIRNVDRPVDVLNRLYVFSPGQARRALELAKRLGLDQNALGLVDDILLSAAPGKRPLCHDLGEIHDCPTSNQVGTALSRQPGFQRTRIEFMGRLRALQLY